MQRLTSALVLGGGVLLMSYINAPAAPRPAPPRVTPAEVAAINAMVSVAEDVAQETERLRARLLVTPAVPVAGRDPFSFGNVRRPERPVSGTPEVDVEAPAAVDAAPAIAWPSLVAVLTDGAITPTRTAVFGIGDGVEMLKVGETTGAFLVRDVGATFVDVVYVDTLTIKRLSIR
ncbi:MAG: hypothetical protein HQ485_05910 [Acidobacteria bacterium]|jgi:hypothetical protein|nr:hypothetical protein [Acidobacteriota bacterium]